MESITGKGGMQFGGTGNKNYLHSTIGYKTPKRFEAEYKTSRAIQLDAA